MQMRLSAVVLVSALLAAPLARAYDTVCYNFTDPDAPVGALTQGALVAGSRGCEGIEGARGRYRDPVYRVDEHRQIFAAAVVRAGLPPTLLETQTLSVLTGGNTVTGATGPTPSVSPWWVPAGTEPASFSAARRSFSLDELAGLPDVSYSLADWAGGNERCPVPVAAPFDETQACHAFATHMGPLNANHFPPQSDRWYDHYHQLALDAARQCHDNRALVWDFVPTLANGETPAAVDARLFGNWQACEVEALAYEAVAQHYLHDSWSAGHMWRRWGPSDVTQWPDFAQWNSASWTARPKSVRQMMVAQGVAAVTGMIHGMDPAIFEKTGALTDERLRFTTHDPLSYPHAAVKAKEAGVEYLGPGGFNALGDLHLHDLQNAASGVWFPDLPSHADISATALPYAPQDQLAYQGTKLVDCAAGSLAQVYEALDDPAERFQPALGDAPETPMAYDRAACRAPMVTNRAFYEGIKGPISFPVSTLAATVVGPRQALIGAPPMRYTRRLGYDYVRLYLHAELRAFAAPDATDVAEAPLTMLGAKPNDAYLGTPTPDIADPPAQDGALPHSGDEATPAGRLSLAFHRARAPEFCYRAETAAVVDSLGATIRRTRRLPDRDPTEHRIREAAVQACAEWVAPFVWNKDSWNTSDPDWQKHHYDAAPLCSYLPGYPSRGFIDPGRSGPHYALADGTFLAGDWAAYPRRSQYAATAVAYDRATAYVGGAAGADSEALAKLMCGAKLDASVAGYRVHGTIRNLHPDAFVGLFLRSSLSPPLSRDKKVWTAASNAYRPLYRRLGAGGTAQNPWSEDEDRVLVRVGGPSDYDYVAVSTDVDAAYTAREGQVAYQADPENRQDPEHVALYAIHGGVRGLGDTHGGGGGATASGDSQYFFNNPRQTLPTNGLYVLQPITPINGLVECDFSPSTVALELNANEPEQFDVDFAATCRPTHEMTLEMTGAGRVFVGAASLGCEARSGVPATCRFRLLGSQTLSTERAVAWGGACGGTGTSCTVTMDGPKAITVAFD
jgi:hypothetical protein